MPGSAIWALAVFALSAGLIAVAGALLAVRLRRRGTSLCMRLAGLDDYELSSLDRNELVGLDDELHDCAKQSDPATATAINTVRRRINRMLANSAGS